MAAALHFIIQLLHSASATPAYVRVGEECGGTPHHRRLPPPLFGNFRPLYLARVTRAILPPGPGDSFKFKLTHEDDRDNTIPAETSRQWLDTGRIL